MPERPTAAVRLAAPRRLAAICRRAAEATISGGTAAPSRPLVASATHSAANRFAALRRLDGIARRFLAVPPSRTGTTGPAEAASTSDDADERPSARDELPPTART